MVQREARTDGPTRELASTHLLPTMMIVNNTIEERQWPYHMEFFQVKILDMTAFKSASLIATIEQCSGWKKWCCYLGEKEGAKTRRQRLHTTEPWEQCWAALFSITTIARPCFSFHLLNTHHLWVHIDALLGQRKIRKNELLETMVITKLVNCGNSLFLKGELT